MNATPRPQDQTVLAGMTNDQLRALCDQGNALACKVLDDRGVEPEVLKPDADPIRHELDIALERQPNARWLRQQAGTLKLEASLLDGHASEYARRFAAEPTGTTGEEHALALALKCAHVSGLMWATSSRLVDLADALDADAEGRPAALATPEGDPIVAIPIDRAATRDDARGEADRGTRTPPHGDALAAPAYEPPYTGDEPLGTCIVHGDFWTDDCTRCGR